MLDLGSQVSIISKRFYRDHLASSYRLKPTQLQLRGYGGKAIACAGCVTVPVQIDNRKFRFTFCVTEFGDSMLGVDLFDALGGSISWGVAVPASAADAVPDVKSVTSSVALPSVVAPPVTSAAAVLPMTPSVTSSQTPLQHRSLLLLSAAMTSSSSTSSSAQVPVPDSSTPPPTSSWCKAVEFRQNWKSRDHRENVNEDCSVFSIADIASVTVQPQYSKDVQLTCIE